MEMITDDFLDKTNRQRKWKLIRERMDSILKSTVGEDTGIQIVPWSKKDSEYSELGEKWQFEARNGIIKYPIEGEESVTKLGDYEIISILLHNLAHAKYSTVPYLNDVPEPSFAFVQLINTLEDLRIEEKLMRRFPGTYDSLKHISDFHDEGIDQKEFEALPDYVNFLLSITRERWGYPSYMTPKAKALYNKTKSFIEESKNAKTTDDIANTFALNKIWPLYRKLVDTSDPDENPFDNQSSDNSQNQNKNDSEGQTDPNGSNNPGNGSSNGGQPDPNPMDTGELDPYKDMSDLRDILQKLSKRADGKTLNDEKIEEPEKKKSEEELKEQKEAKPNIDNKLENELQKIKKDLERDTANGDNYWYVKPYTYEEMYAEVYPYLDYFGRKMRSIMIDNKISRRGGSYREGKLNTKHLYKWKCNSTRVFSKPVLRQHKDYSVSVLVDTSGSMCGDRIVNTAKCTVLLAEVLSQCEIPFEIHGFNERITTFKKLNQPFNWTAKRNLEFIIPESYSDSSGNTNDAFAVNKAAYNLSSNKGEKIIMVLTDGSSNTSSQPLAPEDMKRVAPLGKKTFRDFSIKNEVSLASLHNILLGIGIKTDWVRNNYPNSEVVNKPDELSIKVLGLLKKFIKRG